MKVLIVCGYKTGFPANVAPFVLEQVEALKKYQGIDARFYLVRSKGALGYLNERKGLTRVIRGFNPDVVHAHYGFCGLLANLQRSIPVVTTYHGSDINVYPALLFSRIAIFLSSHNIFVSRKHISRYGTKKRSSLIPCGVDMELFKQIDKTKVRTQLGWDTHSIHILFAGSFNNRVKAPELALQSVSKIDNCNLHELKDYSRKEVCLLLNSVDALLMTSVTEGSPQIIKEAMACGCPIVSVNVGDVKEIIGNMNGSFITKRDPENIALAIKEVLKLNVRTEGRKRITYLGLDNSLVAKRIIQIFKRII